MSDIDALVTIADAVPALGNLLNAGPLGDGFEIARLEARWSQVLEFDPQGRGDPLPSNVAYSRTIPRAVAVSVLVRDGAILTRRLALPNPFKRVLPDSLSGGSPLDVSTTDRHVYGDDGRSDPLPRPGHGVFVHETSDGMTLTLKSASTTDKYRLASLEDLQAAAPCVSALRTAMGSEVSARGAFAARNTGSVQKSARQAAHRALGVSF